MSRDRVIKVVIEHYNESHTKQLKAEDIEGGATLEDLDFDSLDVVELVMAIEEEFEVSVDDDIMDQVETVDDLVKIIEELL